MNDPVISAYSDTYINLTWTALTGDSTGNSAITAYQLYWNAGSGTTATTLVTEALITSYQFATITGGTAYYFRLVAKNVYGTGTTSNTVSISAIDVPGKMSIPSVANSGTNIVVTYTKPAIHSSDVTAYDVQFLKSDSTTGSLTCSESSATALTCTVLTSSVKTLTSLSVDTLVRVKVRAQNSKGWGSYSEYNTAGALVQDVPSVMNAPTVVSASITTTSIPLSWTAPTGTSAGGTGLTIDLYSVQVSSDSGSTWTSASDSISTTSYTYTVTDNTLTYYFKIAAHNIYGW